MTKPDLLLDEKHRVAAVRSYDLLDTLPERDFDNITSLAASICDTPIALITLIDSDRSFLKSYFGLSIEEALLNFSFSGHSIMENYDVFEVEDARKDVRFKNTPLVRDIQAVFYAGAPLISPEGFPLGTLCVVDKEPRTLSNRQKSSLASLAHQVVNLFEARKRNRTLTALQKELQERNEELKNFAGMVSHDMKMPLANMIVTADLLRTRYGSQLDAQGKEYLDYLKQSSFTLSEYITGLLEHYESDKTAAAQSEIFYSQDFLEEIIDLLNINIECEINLPETNIELNANKTALEQIFINLVTNSLKYNDKDNIKIDINCCENEELYYFKIADNGMGIADEDLQHIFDLFATTKNLDRDGKRGNGIGLSTVKKLVDRLNGKLKVSSQLGQGTTFEFSIKKA